MVWPSRPPYHRFRPHKSAPSSRCWASSDGPPDSIESNILGSAAQLHAAAPGTDTRYGHPLEPGSPRYRHHGTASKGADGVFAPASQKASRFDIDGKVL